MATAPASASLLVQGLASNTDKRITPFSGLLVIIHQPPVTVQVNAGGLVLASDAPSISIGQSVNGAITIPMLPIIPATVGDLVQFTFQPFGGSGVYTYSIQGPAGGAVASDGTFTYTPGVAATDQFTLTVFDNAGNGGQVTFQVIST